MWSTYRAAADDVINMTSASFSISAILLLLLSFFMGVSESRKKHQGPVPSFIPGNMNISVSQGDIATLPCTVQNLGTRQVSWKRLGSAHFLTIGTHTWVQDSNLLLEHAEWQDGQISDWNLVIKEARPEDAGTYECQVVHTETIKWRVHLSVTEKPVHRPGKSPNRPRAMNTRQYQGGYGAKDDDDDWRDDYDKGGRRTAISLEGKEYVESGETVYLLCNATEGTRAPDDVDWFKNGDKIEESKYPNVKITKHKQGTSLVSELIIARGRNTDSGTYICRSSLDLIASVEVTVLVAESTNIKRGSGSSQTTRLPSRGENHAVTFTSVLGSHLTLTILVALTSLLTFTFVTS